MKTKKKLKSASAKKKTPATKATPVKKTAPKTLRVTKATQDLLKKGKRFYVENYKPREMILDHGKGSRLWDIDGNEYIDFSSGIAVNAMGHQDKELVNALIKQAKKLWHTSNVFYTEPAIRLAEELVKATFAERVFFCNSGSEANEAAIKLVRKYSSQKHPVDKREIITFTGSFHGRTLAAVTATAQPKYQQGYEPLPGGFTYVSFNDFEAIEKAVTEKTCAVFIEPIQGEGGITPTKPGFLKHVQDLCHKVDALLVLDEVQSGMGRTGKLFAHQHEKGVVPDVMTIAKGIGGGFPLGAMLVGKKAEHVFQFGAHGSTFGGNPMACAVGRAVMKKIQSKTLMQHVVRQGNALRKALEAIDAEFGCFTEIRGKGLIIGAELKPQWHGRAGEILEFGRKQGVLFLQAGPNVLRFLPPLPISDRDLKAGMERVRAAILDFIKNS